MAMPSDGTDANRTVFVGNLDPLVKEEILYELFLQAGPVRRVTMARDREGRRRPFGFVLYKHAEAVPYAIGLLNGICLYGRPLKLGFSTGSSQDTGGSFGSPGTEDRGPNAVRRGVCPQDSPIFNFSGFIPHGDCRSQDQISWRSNVCNWPPCQLPPLTPLTPLPHQVAPHPFPGFFTSTPLQPWPGPLGGFWTPPLTPHPSLAPPPQEREREEPPPPPKEREMERERNREKLPVPPQKQATEREKEKEKEREKEMKRNKHKRMRNRKHRRQSRQKT